MQTRQNKVSEGSIEQLAKNSDQEIDTEKLMRDLRTAYELKKNLRKQEMESFYTKNKTTLKIKTHPCKRRFPYEKVKPKAATGINNQIEPCQQQEMKSVLLMEIENKLHKLRKTGCKEILDNERPRNNKPYFVSCLPPAQTLIKEQLLAELKQYFATNYKN
ncbi:unnamed protein product [Ceratitis capitata]|uniref:(Mediterranean fruit fly) hypothetical protein n=1 Tax=Ceratitis capitata TaxID=7213 RepID=A0A811UJJ9_CERCA|nr:unnamed protein product [Ceratitis capitata]